MITYSIIKKSELEGSLRLDAEYYQPEYLSIRNKLFSSPTLGDISKKITDFGAYSQMNFVEYTETGVRFLRNQDIGDSFIEDSEPIYISGETYKKLSLKLEEYDILTPRVGTIGAAAVVFRDSLPASANQNLAQVKPDINKIDPVYLAVFLNSKFGHSQFDQFATGNVQPWLNLYQIKSIKIFVPPKNIQESVKSLALKVLEEKNKSKSFYSQAENLLLEEIGVKKDISSYPIYNVVNFSEIKKVNRMDAEYFQLGPFRFGELTSITDYKVKPLAEVIKYVPAKFDPAKEPNKSFKYVELSNINSSIGVIDGFSEVLGKYVPSRAKRVLKTGDVLVSSVQGSLGKVALVEKDQQGHLASTGFFQFRSKEILPEALLVLTKSTFFQSQLERRCAGTILTAVPKESIKDIFIPVISKPTQQKIAELVKKSHESCKKAKALLEEAKHKVEQLIENLQST